MISALNSVPDKRGGAAEDKLLGLDDVSIPAAVREALIGLPAAVAETILAAYRQSGRANTARAYARDMAYIAGWHKAWKGTSLPWPATIGLVQEFIGHHLYDAQSAAKNPDAGMPQWLADHLIAQELLRQREPHAPSTVKRRLFTWHTMHKRRGLQSPIATPAIRETLPVLVRASRHTVRPKSARCIGTEELCAMLEACWEGQSIYGVRDAALLLFMWSSGGRRRCEPGTIDWADVQLRPPIRHDETGALEPVLRVTLWETKSTDRTKAAVVVLRGDPAAALLQWREMSGMKQGPVFPRIIAPAGDGRGPRLSKRGLSPTGVAKIVKQRIKEAGLDRALYSAHGIRSGFMTTAGRCGIPFPEAMKMSLHKSTTVAYGYYQAGELETSAAAQLLSRIRLRK